MDKFIDIHKHILKQARNKEDKSKDPKSQKDPSNDPIQQPLNNSWKMSDEEEKIDRPKGMSAWSLKQKKIREYQEIQ